MKFSMELSFINEADQDVKVADAAKMAADAASHSIIEFLNDSEETFGDLDFDQQVKLFQLIANETATVLTVNNSPRRKK